MCARFARGGERDVRPVGTGRGERCASDLYGAGRRCASAGPRGASPRRRARAQAGVLLHAEPNINLIPAGPSPRVPWGPRDTCPLLKRHVSPAGCPPPRRAACRCAPSLRAAGRVCPRAGALRAAAAAARARRAAGGGGRGPARLPARPHARLPRGFSPPPRGFMPPPRGFMPRPRAVRVAAACAREDDPCASWQRRETHALEERVRLVREEGRGVSSQYGREGGGGEGAVCARWPCPLAFGSGSPKM